MVKDRSKVIKPSTTTPIGPGRGYVAPEAGKTHSGGSGSTQAFAASQGFTDVGTPIPKTTPVQPDKPTYTISTGVPATPNSQASSSKAQLPIAFTPLAQQLGGQAKQPQSSLSTPTYVKGQPTSQAPAPLEDKRSTLSKFLEDPIGTIDEAIRGKPTQQEAASGAAAPITAEDMMLYTGIAGLGKAGIRVLAGQLTGNAAKAAAGQTIKETAKYAVNTKTATLASQGIAKAAMATGTKYAAIVMGYVGSYTLGIWAKAEGADTMSMAQNKASQRGDLETEEEIYQMMMDATDPTLWEQIREFIPFVNAYEGVKEKVEGDRRLSIETHKTTIANMEKMQQEKGAGADPTNPQNQSYWDNKEKERQAAKEQERINDEAYYKQIEENRKKAKEEERAADEAYWADIQSKLQQQQEEKRKADAEYWAGIYEEQKKRNEEQRIADEQERERIRKENAKAQAEAGPSKLKFGIL